MTANFYAVLDLTPLPLYAMTEKKNFDELVSGISLKFTGDPETDFSLLFEEAGKIGDGDLARAVVRACSRVIERTLPEENRKKLERLSMTSAAVLNAEIEEIHFTLIKREYAKALPMAESLVRRIEDFKMYQDDSEEEFRCFNEFFEEVLYYQIYKPSRKITRIGLKFHTIYFFWLFGHNCGRFCPQTSFLSRRNSRFLPIRQGNV